jgi:hypothetical protein
MSEEVEEPRAEAEAEAEAEAGAEAAPSRPAPAPSPLTPGARRRSPALAVILAVVVGVAAIVAIAIASGGGDDESASTSEPGTTAEQTQTQTTKKQKEKKPPKQEQEQPQGTELATVGRAAKGATGAARVEDGRLKLEVRGLEAPGGKRHYEVWLYSSLVEDESLGTSRGARIELDAELPGDWKRYRFVDISIEPNGGSPAHSGESVMRVETKKLAQQ